VLNKKSFIGKKVTVMGLGVYPKGSGISAVRFLVAAGAKVLVTDLKTEEDLKVQISRLGKIASKVEFVLGRHRLKDFSGVDMVVKNPGVPRDSKYLKAARVKKIPIETDISLFFQLIGPERIIGITGTRGKSTVSTLLYEILFSSGQSVILGGNVGHSPLAQLGSIKKNTSVVLELSSWMLESLEDIEVSPHMSGFTNIYPDHLNTYRDIDDYAAAKTNIYKWQDAQDYVVLNRDNKYTRKFGGQVPSKRFWVSLKEFKNENGCYLRDKYIYIRLDGVETRVISIAKIKMPGTHNVLNVMFAVCLARLSGIKLSSIRSVVSQFIGVPNRLEFLKKLKGVSYYNDTTSTTPEAGIAAITSLAKTQNIVLIAGGADKGLDFKPWIKEVKKHCQSVVLLKGTGTDRILTMLKAKKANLSISTASSMADAVGLARSFVRSGDIILLSPACASFGMFVNEFDRGDQFRNIIGKLK
jgi:UDP-N-acetylmuramoylalanine--D-glutamate ligase